MTEDSPPSNLTSILKKELYAYELEVFLSEDKLKLFLSAKKTKDEKEPTVVDLDNINQIIKEVIDLKFVTKSSIKDLVRQINVGNDVDATLIAEGTPARDGRDGRLVFLVKQFTPPTPGAQIDSVDARFIRSFDNVEPESIVMRIYPPTSGKNGLDVFGTTIIAKPGTPAEVKTDDSLETLDDPRKQPFQIAVAKRAGFLDKDRGVFTIKDHLEITQDIDYRIGDIDFVGSVHIRGSVMKGFSIIARNNIIIDENIIGGVVHSRNGSISVGGHVLLDSTEILEHPKTSGSQIRKKALGHSGPHIQAKTEVQALLAEGVSIESFGDITITKDIKNCQTRTHQSLYVKEGSLVGGSTFAVLGIEAATIGSPQQTSTPIYASSDAESSSIYTEIKKNIARHTETIRMLKLYLGPYASNTTGLDDMDESYQTRISELLLSLKKANESKQKLEEQLDELVNKEKKELSFQVNFDSRFFPGSTIIAKEHSFSSETILTGPASIFFQEKEPHFNLSEKKPFLCNYEQTNKESEESK